MRDDNVPVAKDLVLVGGGHAHVGVLRRLAMSPVPGLRITLVARDVHTPYSGMLPGHIAGFYDYDACHIDLGRLCRFAGARLYHGEVTGVDLAERRLHVTDRPPVAYDLLSINTGSRPGTAGVAGADRFAIAVKPIDVFLRKWADLLERIKSASGPFHLSVVGGGAGGVELMLSVKQRISDELRAAGDDPARIGYALFNADDRIMAAHAPGVQRRFERVLREQGIAVSNHAPVAEVSADSLRLRSGEVHPSDATLWVTTASAPAWPGRDGLAVDEHGFVRVDANLQSLSHAGVFAAGDLASLPDSRPKSGVFAVRQGPVLAHNLVAAATGGRLRPYRAQKHFLGLITTGGRYAIASRGNWSAEGAWLWTLKDWIDRRFMRMFDELPRMQEEPLPQPEGELATEEVRQTLAQIPMRCGGCGAKVGSGVLERVLGRLPCAAREDVLIGRDTPDDAIALQVPAGHVLVQSVDYFRAFIDDSFTFGRIAANHALGDLYAMGAQPQSALAIATVPYARSAVVEETLFELLSGAQEVLSEAGALLAGGHSSEGSELAFGLTVNGLARPERLLHKAGLRPGQHLILSKPLGTGTLMAADMRYQAKGRWIEAAIASMLQSNRRAAELMVEHGVSACTDITGFGLLGHLSEMLRGAHCGARLSLSSLPVLEGAMQTLAQGILSSLQPENLRLRRAIANQEQIAGDPRYPLLFDPQTAGGLLAGVSAERSDILLQALTDAGYRAARIGEVVAGEPVVEVQV